MTMKVLVAKNANKRESALVDVNEYSGEPAEYFTRPNRFTSVECVGEVEVVGDAADEMDTVYNAD